MSSGPMPNSSKLKPSTGREKTRIHKNIAIKYPTEGAYLLKNKLFPKTETHITARITAPEMSPNPVITASSRVSDNSESDHDSTYVSKAIPAMPHRKRNSAP